MINNVITIMRLCILCLKSEKGILKLVPYKVQMLKGPKELNFWYSLNLLHFLYNRERFSDTDTTIWT